MTAHVLKGCLKNGLWYYRDNEKMALKNYITDKIGYFATNFVPCYFVL